MYIMSACGQQRRWYQLIEDRLMLEVGPEAATLPCTNAASNQLGDVLNMWPAALAEQR